MAMGKIYRPIKRAYRNRRYAARIKRIRAMKNPSNPNYVYKFKQSVNKGNIVIPSTPAVVNGAIYFTLNDLDQVSTYTALYDQYRIKRVTVSFVPRMNMSTAQNSSLSGPTAIVGWFGYLLTVLDFDDNTTLSTENQYREYSTCKMTEFYKKQTRVVYPHAAIAAYSGAFTSYANQRNLWFDCNSPNVQYYGIKYFVPQVAYDTNTYAIYDIWCDYHLEFRNVR